MLDNPIWRSLDHVPYHTGHGRNARGVMSPSAVQFFGRRCERRVKWRDHAPPRQATFENIRAKLYGSRPTRLSRGRERNMDVLTTLLCFFRKGGFRHVPARLFFILVQVFHLRRASPDGKHEKHA